MRLPIGHSDFKKVILEKCDLVDKSIFIEEIAEDVAEVILITRPRRFGKTLNMSMLQYFFAESVDGYSTKKLFENFKISKKEKFCLQYQGQHPVIFLSFKDIKGNSFESIYPGLCEVIKEAYAEHAYLLSSSALGKREKKIYEKILDQDITMTQMISSLKQLTKFLSLHHHKNVMVLLDEYDTPIQSAYLGHYYEQLINFFRNFLSSTLKDNRYLFKAVLTGILRVAKESLFSGMNNISTYSLLNPKYSTYFGFTEPEVSDLLARVNFSDQAKTMKAWYNGYQIGGEMMYNPWSIVNCIRDRTFKPYWVNTSDNALIKDILLYSDTELRNELETLFQNRAVEKIVDEDFVYPELHSRSSAALWSFLLMTGYLTITSLQYTEKYTKCLLVIPNKEIFSLYQSIIELFLCHGHDALWYKQFIDSLLNGDMVKFQEGLKHIMQETVSVHDVATQPEAFYHGLILGLTASLYNHPHYEIRSNRESGNGRYDYLIIAKNIEKISILLEFKRVDQPEKLQHVAQQALEQIIRQDYLAEVRQRGLRKLLIIGIAFHGKRFEMAFENKVL